MKIMGILGIAYGQPPFMGHGHAVAGDAGREDTVEHVDAAGDAFEQAVGRTDAHQITCLGLGQIRRRTL